MPHHGLWHGIQSSDAYRLKHMPVIKLPGRISCRVQIFYFALIPAAMGAQSGEIRNITAFLLITLP